MSPKQLAQLKRLELVAKKQVHGVLGGQYRSAFKAEGIVFSEARPYQPGDDVRRIDWNITARVGEPYLKQYEEERELNVILAVDHSRSMAMASGEESKLDVALSLASLLGFSALANDDRVGLVQFTDQITHYVPAKKGRNHMMRLLSVLQQSPELDRATSLANVCESLAQLSTKKALVFLISDFCDEGYETALGLLAKKHDVVPIIIQDPRDMAWPKLGRLRIRDAETGDLIIADTRSKDTQLRFQNLTYSRQSSLVQQTQKVGAKPLVITVGSDMVTPLKQYFQWRRLTR